MAFLRNKWALAAIVILCWAIVASSAFGYYYYQYTDLVTRVGGPVPISLGIDYANGTRRWFNGTMGATLYDAMLRAGWHVEGKSFGVMGLYITSINGVSESVQESKYWGWWMWTDFGWSHGTSACDKYIVSAGETIILYYSYTDPTTFVMSTPP